MKIHGKSIEPPKPLDVIIPRTDGTEIHLKVQAVLSYEAFDKVCPEPRPPMSAKPGEPMRENWKDKAFQKQWSEWYDKRQGWMAVKSLTSTEGLTFDTMTVEDPNSCSVLGLAEEMRKSGFLEPEIAHVLKQIKRANAMDEKHIEEARERFLRRRAEEQSASS